MKNLALIQARCGSNRLPNKVMKDICGKTDLEWVIRRVQRAKNVDEVIVITSIEKNNLPLIELCASLGVRVFIGSENDVLDRYYQAAKLIKPDYVIRITADCPMIDWEYLDDALEKVDSSTDYLYQQDEDFPDGLDFEVVSFSVLKQIWRTAQLASEREHVTLYIKNHTEDFNIINYKCPIKGIDNLRWTLDEEEDYELIKCVYKHFVKEGKEDFLTKDILAFLKENPEIAKINSMYARNEGLAKSLREDRIVDIGE